ncbi:MAG: HAD-IA family hydrolase [Paludibacteraceae bacterium]|nr:HAD-IA family hydrolase [Paludibacteraceae bacterium]
MDGTLFDSMPNHSAAWEEVMSGHGLHFSAYDCYVNEGRTGQDVIHEAIWAKEHRNATEDEIWAIYEEKTAAFQRRGGAGPIKGVIEVLQWIKNQPNTQIWIVTGSGQKTLFDTLQNTFPDIFEKDKMVTAFDVQKGKPDPEPYLIAWQRSGLKKEECCVIENAPLGIRSGHEAGLFTIGVNTGILTKEDLTNAGANIVFDNMPDFLNWLKQLF